MNTIMDDTAMRLARRIRREREAHGWSQGELAERSEVSKAMISKIERGEASPTAALLVKLATAFELTLATLLARVEGEGGRRTAAADQPVWRDPGTGYIRRQIFARGDHPLELVRVELPPGAEASFPAASYVFIRQVVWVLDGELTIVEGSQRAHLLSGDSYAFGEPANSALVNATDRPCAYLVAVVRR